MAQLKTYTSYTSNCIVFDLNDFCNSYQVCSFLQVGLQRFSKKCPALNICNGNRTEWSPIRSVIIRVINKIGRPRSGSPICLITSMINHNFNKICDIIGYLVHQNTRNSTFCFASIEKKSHLSARLMARTVQLLRHDAYCPIKLSN